MHLPRWCFPALFVLFGAVLPVSAQSVVSTHAGVVNYFEGAVCIGGAPLQAQFGRFPEIADGAELSTADGRAEVLLGPGVILWVAEKSAIKMLSSVLTDTRVELLSGTAVLQSKDAQPGNASEILYKEWRIRVPTQGAFRIDSEPEQLRVYNGEVEVRAAQGAPVTVKAGQTLPLAAVLVPDETLGPPGDEFNDWTFDRSEAIAADNATAAQIVDDPALYPDMADMSGLSMASYTYFPSMTGSGYPYPNYGSYGAWSPYLGSYFGYSGYGVRSIYTLRLPHPGLPGGVTQPPLRLPSPIMRGGGYRPVINSPNPHPGIVSPAIPHPAIAVHPAIRVGHRR